MATLSANDTRLRQIERSRELANALQQSAMSFQPIQHPLQGWAKLAQALAANSISKRADKSEKDFQEEQRKALMAALNPTMGTGTSYQNPGQQIRLDSVHGMDETGMGGPEMLNIPGRREQLMRPRSANEMLGSLAKVDPSMVAGIGGTVAQTSILGQMGMLPQQLEARYREPTGLHKVVSDLRGIGAPESLIRARVAKEVDAKAVNVISPGQERPMAAIELNGRLFAPAPVTEDNMLGLGEDITDSVMKAGVSIQAANFDIFGKQGDRADEILIGYRQSVGYVDSIGKDLVALGDAPLGFSGAVSRGLTSLSAQLQATAKLVGRSIMGREPALQDGKLMAEVGGKLVPEEELFNPAHYNIDLGPIEQNATQAQRIKTQSIQLAYAMARANDPGGRLSEKDVQNQMDTLALDQGSAKIALSALSTIREMLGRNTRIALDVYSKGQYQFEEEPLPGWAGGGSAVRDFPGFAEGTEVVNEMTGEISVIKNGQPVPTGEYVRPRR